MFDVKRINFCISGSYFSIDESDCGLCVKTVRNGGSRKIYDIVLPKDSKIEFEPWELFVTSKQGNYQMCLFGKEGLLIKGKGEGITLKYCEPVSGYNVNFLLTDKDEIRVGDTANNGITVITSIAGKLVVDAPDNVGDESRKFLAKRNYINVDIKPDKNGEFLIGMEMLNDKKFFPYCRDYSFEERVNQAKQDFEQWSKDMITDEYTREAAYILWQNRLYKEGYITRDVIVSAKAGMTRIWSWDNVFHALAIAKTHPQEAFDQLMFLYDIMDDSGKIADSISATTIELLNIKPPVYGWAFKMMQGMNEFFNKTETLSEIYFRMKRNTDWWLNMQGEVPSYYHGNDSGADNSTCFDGGDHIETPELLALLSIQCEFLSDTAKKLKLATDAKTYAEYSKKLFNDTVNNYFDGEIFVRNAETKEKYYCESLMHRRVIILGKRLPKKMSDYLIKEAKEKFIGNYGIASEAINSPKYLTDGYWRGSVWAPDQIMFYSALKELGQDELAEKIKKGYMSAAEKSGFYENYDVHTGEGERCKGMSWPVTAYMYFKNN